MKGAEGGSQHTPKPRGELVHLAQYRKNNHNTQPVVLNAWKKYLVGEEISEQLKETTVADDYKNAPPKEVVSEPKQEEVVKQVQQGNEIQQLEKNFFERLKKTEKKLETPDEKIRAVEACTSFEELVEECLPKIGFVSDYRGYHSPDDMKEILFKAYTGLRSIEEVPLTYGLRTKLNEFMKKNGRQPFSAPVNNQETISVVDEIEEEVEVVAEKVPEVTDFETVQATETIPVVPIPQEEIPVVDEIHEVEGDQIQEKGENWKNIRESYRAYREDVKRAEQAFLEASQAFEEERRNTGFVSRFMKNPSLEGKKEAMQQAQSEYDTLLEGLRIKREERKQAYLERFSKEGEEGMRALRYSAFHEAVLERHIVQEVEKLESLRFNDTEKGESRFRLIRGLKAGFNWYRSMPMKKRLLLGAGIGAAIGFGLGAAGVVAGGAVTVGGVYAGRRLVGGFLGSLAALSAKKYGDLVVGSYVESKKEELSESFTERELGESRKEFQKLKVKEKVGKHVATAGAGIAAFAAGAGVASASSEALAAVAHAELPPDVATPQQLDTAVIESPQGGEVSVPIVSATAEQSSTISNEAPQAPEQVSSIERDVTKNIKTALRINHPELNSEEVEKITLKIEDEIKLHPKMVSKLSEHGNDLNAVWKNGSYDIAIESDFVEKLVKEIHPEIKDLTDTLTSKKIEISGIYEPGSSVERELQQFLEGNEWVKKEYPDLTKEQRGLIAGVLRKELMQQSGTAEQFKIRGGDWSKVRANETYAVTVDSSKVEEAIKKVLNVKTSTQPVAEPVQQVGALEPTQETVKAEPVKIQATQEKVKYPVQEQSVVKESVVNEKIDYSAQVDEERAERVRTKFGIEEASPQQESVKTQITPIENPEISQKTEGTLGGIKEGKVQAPIRSSGNTTRFMEDRFNDFKNDVGKVRGTVENTPQQPSGGTIFTPNDVKVGSVTHYETADSQLRRATRELTTLNEKQGPGKVDYLGEKTRPSLKILEPKAQSTLGLRSDWNAIRSGWGPISHVRINDVFDRNGTVQYTIGDETFNLNKKFEGLSKNFVSNLSNTFEKDAGAKELLEIAKKENITIGEYVERIAERIQKNETSVPVQKSEPVVITPKLRGVQESIPRNTQESVPVKTTQPDKVSPPPQPSTTPVPASQKPSTPIPGKGSSITEGKISMGPREGVSVGGKNVALDTPTEAPEGASGNSRMIESRLEEIEATNKQVLEQQGVSKEVGGQVPDQTKSIEVTPLKDYETIKPVLEPQKVQITGADGTVSERTHYYATLRPVEISSTIQNSIDEPTLAQYKLNGWSNRTSSSLFTSDPKFREVASSYINEIKMLLHDEAKETGIIPKDRDVRIIDSVGKKDGEIRINLTPFDSMPGDEFILQLKQHLELYKQAHLSGNVVSLNTSDSNK